jgi:DNA-binding transcriptional ArsR family regulator
MGTTLRHKSAQKREQIAVTEAIEVQLKKGVLALCVLALLSKADSYAYEIASKLAKAIDMGEGTIYPLMRRMQSDGLVETYLVESQSRSAAQILPPDRIRSGQFHGPEGRMGGLHLGRRKHPGSRRMTRAEFLTRLKRGLAGLPAAQIADIVADYEAHFNDAQEAGRSESEVAAALGEPERLAREQRAEQGVRRWEETKNPSAAAGAIFAILGLGALDLFFLAARC